MDNNILNSPVPEISRHERKLVPSWPQAHEGCASVCSHPQREAIEEAFLHWQSPTEIATEHEPRDLRFICRHAPSPPNRQESRILIANPELEHDATD